jgi:prefoldin beta subunit
MNRIDSMRQDYLLKKNENELVKQELELLEEDSVIYKLIGPALVKQALPEAKANVDKRLEFINSEIERLVKHRKEFLKRAEE